MDNVNHNGKGKLAITVAAVLATFLLMAFLVRQMVKVTNPAPVGANIGVARAEENAKIRAAGVDVDEPMRDEWGAAAEYVDPDGYRIALFEPPR